MISTSAAGIIQLLVVELHLLYHFLAPQNQRILRQPMRKNPKFDLMREADLLYDSYLIDNAYGVLRRFRNSENPEMLWRLARVLCEKGKQCQNSIEKKRLFDEALEIADKAIKNEYYWGPQTGNFGAHKWYAIILNYSAEMEGTKAQIQKSKRCKNTFGKEL